MLGRGPSEWNGNVFTEIPDVIVAGKQTRFDVPSEAAAGIEADGPPGLHPIRIGVDRRPGEICRVVELLWRVSRGDSPVSCRALGEPERRAPCSVPVCLVSETEAISAATTV